MLALSVGVGLGVLAELMEGEVEEVVGPKGRHSADGEREQGLVTYAHFASRDALSRVVLERMLARVSCRRYVRTQEPVGTEVEQKARSSSKSSVSRRFVERTREALGRDAHPHPARHRRQPGADARVDEPVRVDDRVRPAHEPKRQALVVR